MMIQDRRQFIAALSTTGVLAASNLANANWNQWRGPTRDGNVPGDMSQWPESLGDDSLKLVWEQAMGPSYSGPVVMDGLIYTTETVDRKSERVIAYDVPSGKEAWRAQWPGAMRVPMFAMSNGSWIRSTPVVTQDHLLVGGIRDVLVCLDPKSGEEQWRNDFVQTQESKVPSFGFVCSPLVDGDYVFVQAGGALLKLEIETGKVVWRSLDDGGGMYGSAFSSPVLVDLLGQRQLLVQTRKELNGVDPDTGEKLWSTEVPSFRGMNILPPTVRDNVIFTSTYRNGSFGYRVDKNGDQYTVSEQWKNNVQGYMSSPMVFGDHVYLHLSNGRLTCMEIATGEQKWSSRPYGKYWSSIAQGNRMLSLDERGDLLLVEPNAAKFQLVGQQKVANNSWAHLGMVDDLVLVRDLEKLMVYRWAA